MNIEYVNISNFDLLENAYIEGIANSKEITKDFGKNLPLLLSHIKISFIISEISIIETYMVKKFCNGNLIDIETYLDDNKINNEKFPKTYSATQSLFQLTHTINNDDDVAVKPGLFMFPCKNIEKKVVVSFEGNNILSIIGTITRTQSIFNDIYIEMDRTKESKDVVLKNILIKYFINEFYKYMSYKIQYIDLLTDSTLNAKYLSEINELKMLISPSHVNTFYGELSFMEDTDVYQNKLNLIKLNKKDTELVTSDFVKETTEVFFICNTSFYSFLEAFIYLPIGSILESTDIKILYSSTDYIIPIEMNTYKSRVTSIITKMKGERDLNSKELNKNLDILNLIPLNTRIQYSMHFKLSELGSIIIPWENKIKNNLYGDTNGYLSRELLKMIATIKSVSIAVYKAIDND